MQQDSRAHRYQDAHRNGYAEGDALGNHYAYRYAYGYHATSAAAWRRCALTGGGDATDAHSEPYAISHTLCGACAAREHDCSASAADVGGTEGAPEGRWVDTQARTL